MAAGGSAHCFCCFEEEGAVELVKCGCKCTTMCACAPCLWKITSEPKPVSFHAVKCTVCLEFFSDAAVLAGCKHARNSVAALPRTLEARSDMERDVLQTMMQISTAEPAFEYARELWGQYSRALGARHGTTSHFKYLMGKVLYTGEDFQGAINVFEQVLDIQEAVVQERDLEKATDEDKNWLLRLYRTKSAIAASLHNIYKAHGKAEKDAEAVFCEALAGMRTLVDDVHPDYVRTAGGLASFLAARTARECAGGAHDRPRTRQQHALLTRALAAAEHALEVCLRVYGATSPITRILLDEHAMLRAMESA
jgi:hypothetical protein